MALLSAPASSIKNVHGFPKRDLRLTHSLSTLTLHTHNSPFSRAQVNSFLTAPHPTQMAKPLSTPPWMEHNHTLLVVSYPPKYFLAQGHMYHTTPRHANRSPSYLNTFLFPLSPQSNPARPEFSPIAYLCFVHTFPRRKRSAIFEMAPISKPGTETGKNRTLPLGTATTTLMHTFCVVSAYPGSYQHKCSEESILPSNYFWIALPCTVP